MTDLGVRHPVLELRRMSGGGRLLLDPALELGVGGEARVLGLPGDPARVAKLYHRADLARARKLSLMLGRPPVVAAGAALAWPQELVADVHGRFAGFLMPRAEGPRVFELYNPVARRRLEPLYDWGRLHRVGMNVAAAFAGVHASGYVVGDVNESNLVVSPQDGSVTLVDTDSFQVRDPRTGEVFRSAVGKAEFTPAELQGARFDRLDRTPAHDAFGLGVLLYLLLMEGTHPYAIRMDDGAPALAVEERIRRGLAPCVPGARARPPRMAPLFDILHPELQALFIRCFSEPAGAARPSAEEWGAALARAEAVLRGCGENPHHRFGPHLDYCPWCHRRALLRGRDPFPATVALARAVDQLPAPPRPPRAAAPAVAAAPAPMPVPAPYAQPATLAPITLPIAAFLGGVRAGLPTWIAGDHALASPVPWLVPGLFTVIFAGSGGLRMLGMLVLFVAIRRIFRAGAGPLRVATAVWTLLLLLCWASFASLVQAMNGADSHPLSGLQVDVPAGEAGLTPLAAAPAGGGIYSGELVYSPTEVDVPAHLTDAAAQQAMLAARLGPVLPGETPETALVRLTVSRSGAVQSAQLISASSPGFSAEALKAVRQLQFMPALRNGQPVTSFVEFSVQQGG